MEGVPQSVMPRAVFCSARNTFMICNKDQLWGVGSLKKGLLMVDQRNKLDVQLKRKQLLALYRNEEIFQGKSLNNEQAERDSDCFLRFIHLKYFLRNRVVFLSCTSNHALVVTQKGYAYGWGDNTDYQLGLGYSSDQIHVPHRIAGPLENKQIVLVMSKLVLELDLHHNIKYCPFRGSSWLVEKFLTDHDVGKADISSSETI